MFDAVAVREKQVVATFAPSEIDRLATSIVPDVPTMKSRPSPQVGIPFRGQASSHDHAGAPPGREVDAAVSCSSGASGTLPVADARRKHGRVRWRR